MAITFNRQIAATVRATTALNLVPAVEADVDTISLFLKVPGVTG